MLYMNIYPIYDPPSVSGANIGNPICHPAVPGRRLTPVAPSCYVECWQYHGRCGDIALLMLWLGMRHRRLQKTKDILVNTCKRNMFCDNFALFTYAYIGGTFFFGVGWPAIVFATFYLFDEFSNDWTRNTWCWCFIVICNFGQKHDTTPNKHHVINRYTERSLGFLVWFQFQPLKTRPKLQPKQGGHSGSMLYISVRIWWTCITPPVDLDFKWWFPSGSQGWKENKKFTWMSSGFQSSPIPKLPLEDCDNLSRYDSKWYIYTRW